MNRTAGLLGIAAAFALAGASLGCGPGDAKAPNPTRVLDERRAVEVIRRAIVAEGARPVGSRDEKLASGKTLRIDVGVDGHGYGVSYVTTDEATQLGDAIPPRNQKDEKLKLVRVGKDGEIRIVLLYQANYLYDDLAGEEHEQTTITCERSLARDVQDFISHAKGQHFP
jgi:hypothetical protein